MPQDLARYFRALTSERSVRAIALRAQLDQTTLNRQLTGRSTLTVEVVVAICRAYDLDMADVFVTVGFITEEEARSFGKGFALAEFTDQDLTREMVRRLDVGEATPAASEPVPAAVVEDVLAEKRAEKAARDADDLPYVGTITPENLPANIAASKGPRKGESDDEGDDTP